MLVLLIFLKNLVWPKRVGSPTLSKDELPSLKRGLLTQSAIVHGADEMNALNCYESVRRSLKT